MLNIRINFRMKKYYNVLSLIYIIFFSSHVWAITEPSVFTETKQTISVNGEGLKAIPLFIQEGVPIYSIDSAETQSVAIALSTQPAIGENNLPSASGHFASAEISLAIPSLDDSLVTFQSAAKTEAKSVRYEPLFAKSYVYSKGSSVNKFLSNGKSVLNFDWNYQKYKSVNRSGVSFSKITDSFRVIRQNQNNLSELSISELILNTSIESGVYSSSLQNPGSLENKIDESFGYGFKINLNDSNEKIEHIVKIEHIHSEFSIEAPARATNRVEEKVGYKTEEGKNMMFWDSDNNKLSFNPFPITVLNNGEKDIINRRYKDDPLVGGVLRIGDFNYLGNDAGIDYFGGSDIELVDKKGNIIFRASLPTLAFEELNGFNLFAPIVNILETDDRESIWLRDYLSKGGIDSLLLHELFIGFDNKAIADFSWENSFSSPATALLSYTGIPTSVPEPAIWILFSIGLVILKFNVQSSRKK